MHQLEKAPGNSGKLKKHTQSTSRRFVLQNAEFRRQETSVLNQLFGASEIENKENRDRMGDLFDCAYYLFKNKCRIRLYINHC